MMKHFCYLATESTTVCTPVQVPCVFPFTFESKTYTECTTENDKDNRPWCSVKVDTSGKHIQGNYEYCDQTKCSQKQGNTFQITGHDQTLPTDIQCID